MFKFIQNLVPKDETRVKFTNFWVSKCLILNRFSAGKKRAEEKQEKTSLRTRLPWFTRSTYTYHWTLCNPFLYNSFFALQFPLTSISLIFFIYRSAHPTENTHDLDDSRSTKWWDCRQDPWGITWAWCRCRSKRCCCHSWMVGETTTSSERYG